MNLLQHFDWQIKATRAKHQLGCKTPRASWKDHGPTPRAGELSVTALLAWRWTFADNWTLETILLYCDMSCRETLVILTTCGSFVWRVCDIRSSCCCCRFRVEFWTEPGHRASSHTRTGGIDGAQEPRLRGKNTLITS